MTDLAPLIAQGLTLREIGDRLDLSEATVSKRLREAGIRPNGRAPNAYPSLKPLVDRGLTQEEIARETGLGLGAVRHRLRSQGLRTDHAREGRTTGRPLALGEVETRAIVERARELQETRAGAAQREQIDRATLRAAMRRYGVEWYR